jgi:hypothetical protein
MSDVRRSSRLGRALRIAVVAMVSLFAVYVVAINVFLSTSLFAKVVNAQPDTIEIQFARAWSVFPQHVHARQLSIRGRDGSVEWILRLDKVEFDVSLLALARQRFEASNVHGDGLSMRLRQRLRAAPASAEDIATLPPIEGFPPYSIRPPQTPSPGLWNDAQYHLWSVRIEGIVARDVREVWIDHARFEGAARIDGRFYLKPLRAVEVGPAKVTAARGGVYTGERPLAEALDGTALDFALGRFDPRTAAGPDLLHSLSVSADARGVLPDLARLPIPLPPGMSVRGPAEIRRALLRVSSGVLQKDGHLDLSATSLVATWGRQRIAGSLAFEADVAAAPFGVGNRLALHAVMGDAELSRVPDGASVRASRVIATGDAGALDLARPLEDLHFVFEMPDATMAAANELTRYIPPNTPVAIVRGQAEVSARIEGWLAEKRVAGRGTLRSEDLDVRLAKMDARGRMSVQAAFGSYGLETRRLEQGSLAIRVSTGSLSSSAHPDAPVVRLRRARLDASAPVVDPADPLRELRVTLSMPDSEVVSGAVLEPYLPRMTGLPTGSGRARFSLEGRLAIGGHLARGSLDLLSKELRLTYGPMRLDASLGVRARVHDWRWESGDLALDEARVEVQDVAIRDSRSTEQNAPPAMTVARIAANAKSPRFQLDKPLALVTLSARVTDANVRDSAAVNAMLPEGASFAFDVDGGHFETRLDVTIEDRVGWGTARATGTNIGAGDSTFRLRGDIDLKADFVGWNLQRNTVAWLDSRLAMTHVAGRLRDRGPAQFTAERLALLTRRPHFELQRPTLRGADFHLVVDRAELPDAAALTPLLSADGTVGIASGAANAAADLRVSSSQGTATGGIDVDVDRAGVWIDQKYVSGDFRLRARVRGFDPESESLDVTGSRVEMRDVAVSGASAATTDWRGDVLLAPASLRFAGDPLFDGVVGLEARDARPVLAMAFGDSLPRFVIGLIAMPGLRASARVVASAHQLAMLDLDARGGDVAIRGSYAERDDHRRAAIVARKAFLSVGIRVDDDGVRLRLFRLQRWLRERTRDVRKLVEVPGGAAR